MKDKLGVLNNVYLQILNSLREELKKQEDELADYQSQYLDSEAEWITEGWCEALTFAITQIENIKKQSEINCEGRV